MIESIKTALASWLRAEVFALVGEAMKGHDQDQTDMLNEIHALKREVAALREELADNSSPSAQQVAECISVADLRKALSGADLSSGVKSAIEDQIEDMDLAEEIKEALEKKVDVDADFEDIAKAVVSNEDFMRDVLNMMGQRLCARERR